MKELKTQEEKWMDELYTDILETGQYKIYNPTPTEEGLIELAKIMGDE